MNKISDAIVALHNKYVLDCILSTKTLNDVNLIERTYYMAREFLIAGNERKATHLYIIGLMLSKKLAK